MLEGLDTPGDALVEPAFIGVRCARGGVLAVDPRRGLGGHWGVRGEMANVSDERQIVQPLPQRGDAVGEDVGPHIPRVSAVGGTTHSSVSKGRSSECG